MSVFGGSDLGDPDDAHLQGFAYDRFELPGRYSLALSDGEEDADFLGTGLGGLANLDRMSAAAGMDLDTVSDGGGDWLRADLASLQQYQELLQDGGDRHRRSSTAAAVCNYVLGTGKWAELGVRRSLGVWNEVRHCVALCGMAEVLWGGGVRLC